MPSCGIHKLDARMVWEWNYLVCLGELEARDTFAFGDYEAAVKEYETEKDLDPDAHFEIWWRAYQQTTPRIMRIVDNLEEGHNEQEQEEPEARR